MSYWDIKGKVNKMVKDHEKSRTKNRVVPWWSRDDFVSRGDSREKKQLKKQWWKNWEKLDNDL
jgi:hypothetical protein